MKAIKMSSRPTLMLGVLKIVGWSGIVGGGWGVGIVLIPDLVLAQASGADSVVMADLTETPTPLDLKRILLNPDDETSAYVSLGLKLREQYEGFRNRDLGLAPVTDWDDVWFHRLYLNAALVKPGVGQVLIELGNSTILGHENALSPLDQDELYVHQAYIDLNLGGSESSQAIDGRLRLGRQELTFGSGRLLATRNGPNVRLSYDGGRATLAFEPGVSLDLFVLTPVRIEPDNFDNPVFEPANLLWGAYYIDEDAARIPGGFEMYYLGLRRREAVLDAGVGEELRHTLGFRLFGARAGWDWNVEPIAQLGRFAGRDLLAWSVGSDVGVRLDAVDPLSPRFGLRANVISGGSSDDSVQTFNALFPNNSYFSEAALFAPSNLIDVNPSVSLFPHKDVTLLVMWDFLWRYDTGDAIYSPPGVPAIAGSVSDARYIGNTLSVSAEWRVRPSLTLSAAFTQFWAGSAVTDAGGDDVTYTALWLDWEF